MLMKVDFGSMAVHEKMHGKVIYFLQVTRLEILMKMIFLTHMVV